MENLVPLADNHPAPADGRLKCEQGQNWTMIVSLLSLLATIPLSGCTWRRITCWEYFVECDESN